MAIMHKSGTPKLPEIEIGSGICTKLKKIFFDGNEWADVCHKVSDKFTVMKKIYRELFPNQTDLEMLKMLSRYSLQDLEEIFLFPVPEKKKTIIVDDYSERRK